MPLKLFFMKTSLLTVCFKKISFIKYSEYSENIYLFNIHILDVKTNGLWIGCRKMDIELLQNAL